MVQGNGNTRRRRREGEGERSKMITSASVPGLMSNTKPQMPKPGKHQAGETPRVLIPACQPAFASGTFIWPHLHKTVDRLITVVMVYI